MKKKVLFVLRARNSYGLFKSFAHHLVESGREVVFADVSYVVGEKPNPGLREKIIGDGFLFIDPHALQHDDAIETFIQGSQSLLDQVAPNLVVVPYEFHFFFFVVQEAKARGIPTLHIQHGLWGPGKFLPGYNRNTENESSKASNSPRHFFSLNRIVALAKSRIMKTRSKPTSAHRISLEYTNLYNKGILFPLTADYIAVPSRYYKNIVLNEVENFSESRVLEVGYTRSDLWLNPKFQNISPLHDLYGVPKDKKIVSYFYAAFHLLQDRFKVNHSPDEALIDFMKAVNHEIGSENVHFLIFFHPTAPNNQPDLRQRLKSAKLENFQFAFTNDDQDVIYRDSFIVAGVKSGALTESAMFNPNTFRQIYVLEGLQEPFQIDFGLVIPLSHPSHLNRQIVSAIHKHDDNAKKRDMSYILGHCDGMAAVRLLDQLSANQVV